MTHGKYAYPTCALLTYSNFKRVLLQSQAVKSYKKQNYACLWIQLLIL